jgi:hypothetical protein
MVDFESSQGDAFWDKYLVQRSLDLTLLEHNKVLGHFGDLRRA